MFGRCGKFLLSVVVAGVSMGFVHAQDDPRTTPEEINKLIAKMKSVDTAGWAKIPWVGSLEAARKVSQQEHAPIFLFVHDGNVSTGRC